jgi:hypothetical protein
VRVRVVGDGAFGWAEAASVWGANVEIIVHGTENNHGIRRLFSLPLSLDAGAAILLPTSRPWPGVLLATARDASGAQLVGRFLKRWRPRLGIVAVPGEMSRRVRQELMVVLRAEYGGTFTGCGARLTVRHADLGGVTRAKWHFLWLAQPGETTKPTDVMTGGHYPRVLQTVLDDTVGGAREKASLEVLSAEASSEHSGAWGTLRISGEEGTRLVFDGEGQMADLCAYRRTIQRNLPWVRSRSVYTPDAPVLRPLRYAELLGAWDYEGKLEARDWSAWERAAVQEQRLGSPPGKMLRTLGFQAMASLLAAAETSTSSQENNDAGLTRDVPVGALEREMDAKCAAATNDNAAIDLSQWGLPDETLAQGRARVVLRRFAAKWWRYHQERKAEEWLTGQHRHRAAGGADAAGVRDCIRRIRETGYWSWPRGSRLFFWKFPAEWQADARDGVRFWHLEAAPQGAMKNMKAESREAELATREKVFKLRFQWLLEAGDIRLVVPRFLVVKVMEDGVVTDIRVVWDGKANGHNDTLWQPGFSLPGFEESANLVAKWLPMTVREYLELGSPEINYSQDPSRFVKAIQL